MPNRCDLCPNADDTVDSDGDAVPDACDRCTSIGDEQEIADAKLRMFTRFNHPRLATFSGSFRIGTSFAAVDPATTGARIVVRQEGGYDALDIVVPGGAYDGTSGWRTNAAQTRHSYTEPAAEGVHQLLLVDKGSNSPGLVRFKLKASNFFDWPDLDFPHHNATIIVGDAAQGECGETKFHANECTVSSSANRRTMLCR